MASGLRPPASKNTSNPRNQSRSADNDPRETPPTLKHRHEAKIVVGRKRTRSSKSDSRSRPRSRRQETGRQGEKPHHRQRSLTRPSPTNTERRSSFTGRFGLPSSLQHSHRSPSWVQVRQEAESRREMRSAMTGRACPGTWCRSGKASPCGRLGQDQTSDVFGGNGREIEDANEDCRSSADAIH